MREFWVTVGAMVLGYVMYIIVKSISKKLKEEDMDRWLAYVVAFAIIGVIGVIVSIIRKK